MKEEQTHVRKAIKSMLIYNLAFCYIFYWLLTKLVRELEDGQNFPRRVWQFYNNLFDISHVINVSRSYLVKMKNILYILTWVKRFLANDSRSKIIKKWFSIDRSISPIENSCSSHDSKGLLSGFSVCAQTSYTELHLNHNIYLQFVSAFFIFTIDVAHNLFD